MKTVAIIDTVNPSDSFNILKDSTCIPIVITSYSKASKLLLNNTVDLLICNIDKEASSFPSLHKNLQVCNTETPILLTGSSNASLLCAKTLITKKLAKAFIPSPWDTKTLKSMMTSLIDNRKNEPIKENASAKKIKTAPHKIYRLKTSNDSNALPILDSNTEARYRIEKIIGEGGIGKVCKAYDTLLEMDVAVKILNPDTFKDKEAIESLIQETRICLNLMHRHIVRIYNLEKYGNSYALIMEYVEGSSLLNLIREYPTGIPANYVGQIVNVVSDALSYAHRHNVLHKDITPGNVLISDDGVLKLIDFGIADSINRKEQESEYIYGTPAYMSPEQLRGEEIDARSDIYALGVLTTQMLTGKIITPSDADFETLAYKPHAPIEGVNSILCPILEKATAFNPEDRWDSIARFSAAFIEALS